MNWIYVRDLRGGGQGLTYEVRHKSSGVRGALKCLPLAAGSVAEKRFSREIEILREIHHPSVAPIVDASTDGTPQWCVTPLGEPLMIPEVVPAARFDWALDIVYQLTGGLSAVHDLNIVHRDIKAGNVILLGPGDATPVLIDFGIALRPQDDERLTAVDNKPVANSYMAPPAAYYGQVDDVTPWWDCLCLAWLWAWLIGDGTPKGSRLHWKYHRFIDDPRCERVRSVLAACTIEEVAPRDGHAFGALMEELHLNGSPTPRESSTDMKKAIDAQASARASYLLGQANAAEHLAASVELQRPFALMLRQEFNRLVAPFLKSLPLQLDTHQQLGWDFQDSTLNAAMSKLSTTNNTGLSLASCSGGHVDGQRLHIHLLANRFQTSESPPKDVLPFRFILSLWHEGRAFQGRDVHVRQDRSFAFRRDRPEFGLLSSPDAGELVSLQDVMATVAQWLSNPVLWGVTP